MLWPFVLPLQIIFYFLLGMLVLAFWGTPLVKREWRSRFLWALGLIVLVFCLAFPFVMEEIDSRRFGVFSHATFNDVQDLHVTRYLPPTARDIIVEKERMGFRAQYKITEPDLEAYIDDLWLKYGDRSNASRAVMEHEPFGEPEMHPDEYSDLGWPVLPDAKLYHSPRAGNGAGFIIWFSPSQGIAYERAGYW